MAGNTVLRHRYVCLSVCTVLTRATSRHVTSRHQVYRSLCTVLTQTPSRHSLSLHIPHSGHVTSPGMPVCLHSPQSGPVTSPSMPFCLHSHHSGPVNRYATLSAQFSLSSRHTGPIYHQLFRSVFTVLTQALSHHVTKYAGLPAVSSLRSCHVTSPGVSVCIVLTQATSRDVTGSRSVCTVLTQAPSCNVICKSVCTVLIHSRRIDHTLEQR